ncbi:MAG: hypothetical protein Q4C49_14155 [Bacillota bacterium]|nr:hypothetical protein [Bacillota bacterium]
MVDEKLLKEFAEPILEQLEKLQKKVGSDTILQIPKIRLMMDPSVDTLKLGDKEVDEEFLKALEEYIQEELEMMNEPTVLH